MRAYLIVRFEELFESTSIAVLLSTVLFVAYHGYQGTAGMISVALFGVIQAIVFCLFRRLAPISLAHSINNFIDIGRVLRI
jgi:membrane protease YdiL (CAAX protease family)